jgi:ribosome-associated protein
VHSRADDEPETFLLPTPLNPKMDKPAAVNKKSDMSAVEAALAAILTSLDDSKAEDVVTIDIEGKSAMCDRLVIASGRSHRHVAALAEHLLTAIKDAGHGVARVEGMPNADWVLIDQGDVIVHLFRPEVRAFYNIEKMWQVPDLELEGEGTVH